MDCENCLHLTVVGLHDTGPWLLTAATAGLATHPHSKNRSALMYAVKGEPQPDQIGDNARQLIAYMPSPRTRRSRRTALGSGLTRGCVSARQLPRLLVPFLHHIFLPLRPNTAEYSVSHHFTSSLTVLRRNLSLLSLCESHIFSLFFSPPPPPPPPSVSCAHVRARAHTHTRTPACTREHTHIHTRHTHNTHTPATHTHTHKHATHTHTHTHTHAHT